MLRCQNNPARTNDRVRRGCGTWHDTDANPPGHVAKQSGVVALQGGETAVGRKNKGKGRAMKKYTQADFDNFEVDEYGHKICPAGDYTAMKSFGEGCNFSEGCSFGEGCSYENDTVKNGRYVAVDRIGSKNRKAYFYIDENGNMFVRAGCWFSDMAAFKERVKKVHAGTIHEKTYLAACDLAELMLKGGNEE